MKPDIKQLWCEKLTSGEYTQAKGALLKEGPVCPRRFCCLGVLADIWMQTEDGKAHQARWAQDQIQVTRHNQYDDKEYQVESDGTLIDEVQDWARLTASNPHVWVREDVLKTHVGFRMGTPGTGEREGWLRTTLAELNDNGFSFAEIAEIIKEQL